MHALALAVSLSLATQDAPCGDLDARDARTHALLAAFADDARGARHTSAVSSGVVGAGLIGAGIAYVAVSYADHQLAVKDAEDTRLAGYVLAGSAVVPAALMVAQLVTTSPEEDRLAAFEASSDKQ